MPAISNALPVLALLGLDGQKVTRLFLVESAATSAIFAPPPDWLPKAAGLSVPYRVIAHVSSTPVPVRVMQILMEWTWQRKGLESQTEPGWFYADGFAFEETLQDLDATFRNPERTEQLLKDLNTSALRLRHMPDAAADLWSCAQAISPFAGPRPSQLMPVEQAAHALLEQLLTVSNPGLASTGPLRAHYDRMAQASKELGSLSPSRWDAQLQAFLGNKGPLEDSLKEYLHAMNQAFKSDTVAGETLERESAELLGLLRILFYAKGQDFPELSQHLSLSYREALLSLNGTLNESDPLFLGWAKRQLVPSFLNDPVYRKRIFGGMALCSLVVLYIAPAMFAMMAVLAAMGYYSVKRRG